jgi:hypothetical protein
METKTKVRLRSVGGFDTIYALDTSDVEEGFEAYEPLCAEDFANVTAHFTDDYGHTALLYHKNDETRILIADSIDLEFYPEGE